jgi:ABC-type anion transport system duplicated permease subunit
MLATPSVVQVAELRRRDLLHQAARERQISQVRRAARSVRASKRPSAKLSLASAVTALPATPASMRIDRRVQSLPTLVLVLLAGLLRGPDGVEAR